MVRIRCIRRKSFVVEKEEVSTTEQPGTVLTTDRYEEILQDHAGSLSDEEHLQR